MLGWVTLQKRQSTWTTKDYRLLLSSVLVFWQLLVWLSLDTRCTLRTACCEFCQLRAPAFKKWADSHSKMAGRQSTYSVNRIKLLCLCQHPSTFSLAFIWPKKLSKAFRECEDDLICRPVWMVCLREWDPRQGICPPHCLLVPQISGPVRVWGTFCLAEPSILTWVAEFPVCRALLMQTKRNRQQRWSSKQNLQIMMAVWPAYGKNLFSDHLQGPKLEPDLWGAYRSLQFSWCMWCFLPFKSFTSNTVYCMSPCTMNHALMPGPYWARTVSYLDYLKNSTAAQLLFSTHLQPGIQRRRPFIATWRLHIWIILRLVVITIMIPPHNSLRYLHSVWNGLICSQSQWQGSYLILSLQRQFRITQGQYPDLGEKLPRIFWACELHQGRPYFMQEEEAQFLMHPAL